MDGFGVDACLVLPLLKNEDAGVEWDRARLTSRITGNQGSYL